MMNVVVCFSQRRLVWWGYVQCVHTAFTATCHAHILLLMVVVRDAIGMAPYPKIVANANGKSCKKMTQPDNLSGAVILAKPGQVGFRTPMLCQSFCGVAMDVGACQFLVGGRLAVQSQCG